jgi:hypothetical protein
MKLVMMVRSSSVTACSLGGVQADVARGAGCFKRLAGLPGLGASDKPLACRAVIKPCHLRCCCWPRR